MDADIREALQYCPNLPSMSDVAMRIVELGRESEVNTSGLAALLSRDPAVASRILRVSNSPLYGQRRRSRNLQQAVSVIGLNGALTLALTFSLADSLRQAPGSASTIDYVWRRALVSAAASRELGAMLGRRDLEELFLAGLLQDIGILALEAALPERYGRLLAVPPAHDRLLELEAETLGCDHGEAGAWLMRYWRLPEYLALAAHGSHDPLNLDVADSERFHVHCVAVAGRVADLFLGIDHDTNAAMLADRASRWLALDRGEVEALLDRLPSEFPDLERLFETRIISHRRAAGVVDQAREVLAMRSLQLLDRAGEQHRRSAELERNTRLWRETASRDPLTGIHNRRYLDERLEAEFARAREHGWPLVIGFLDLDYFKVVNDRYGHPVGDSVLMHIAGLLSRHLRDGDCVARYGGEEFVVMLPGADREAAEAVFERLRAALADEVHTGEDGRTFHVTASIGVVAYAGDNSVLSTAALVRAADRALYRAKDRGRNQISFGELDD
ncbi:GGDEF domain-containing protein [Aquisalimonas sp.]|uniref:GGDEF domain-containing protein n=1 Tax=unclassified Aquisalimonas TaxID=2644645 RepID=UPI0025BFED8E|nr:GGDEF domain-containing protein [Aquisalimonas sp.]